ncbi:hypothetical protein ACLMJK_002168 [Lecanora helva]
MAIPTDLGEPEVSEDDSVSLTSTIESDGEGKEYDVDRILAEWETEGVMWYLTKWEGYPEVQATWQDRQTFNPSEEGGHDAFKDWQERKMRVTRGYEEPYDISDWERKFEEAKNETNRRRARRRRKKMRLKKIVDGVPSSEDESNIGNIYQGTRSTSTSSSYSNDVSEKTTSIHEASDSRRVEDHWTSSEKQVFMQGLQTAGGLDIGTILGNHGSQGSISQVLKHKKPKDLRKQMRVFREEFMQVGRDPPQYLIKRDRSIEQTSIVRRRKKTTSKRGIASSNESSSSGSDTHVQTQKMPDRKGIKKETSDGGRISNVIPHASQFRANTKDTKHHIALTGQSSDAAKDKPTRENLQSPTHSKVQKKPYLGTARTTTSRPNVKSRVGIPGSGPARVSTSQRKLTLAGPIAKKKPSGIDVTANWSGQRSIKKAKTLPTTNTATTPDKPLKIFKSLGIRNSVQKWRQNEPVPDPSQLLFVDTKTGKVPKTLPTSSTIDTTVRSPQKSPFQRFQEEFAAKEATRRRQSADDDVGMVDNSASHPGDVDTRVMPKIDVVSGVGGNVPNERGSATTTPKTTIEHSQDLSTNPLCTAPRRPRAYAPHASHSDSQHHIRSPSTLAQTLPTPRSNRLVLMERPKWTEKNDLFKKIEETLIIGNIRFGPKLQDAGKMKLAGFSSRVQQMLLTVKDITKPRSLFFDFSRLCTATDYHKYWHDDLSEYQGSGHVVPYPQNEKNYESLAQFLACYVSIGVFVAKDFTMLLWPTNLSIWEPLETKLPQVPPGTILRFAVREPISSYYANQSETAMTRCLRLDYAGTYSEITSKIDNLNIESGDSQISVVFREHFGIDFARLIASSNRQRSPLDANFFLCFIPANIEQYEPDTAKRQALRSHISDEHDVFVQFLRTNGAEAIYSLQDLGSPEAVNIGSWRHFIDNVRSGAVIIHESCGRPDQLPHLAKFLYAREGVVNVWMTSLSPMDLSGRNHPHLVRCFPHGGVILLTHSLMIYHPNEALRLLRWFRLEQLPSKPPGTWKIAVRPRIREWLLDVHDICCEKTQRSPFGDFDLNVYADIHTEILLLLDREVEPFGLMVEEWDTEVPLPEAPVVAEIELPRGRREWTGESFETAKIDHNAICWNDDELIQWFAEWAGLHIYDHRKFHVVLGYPKGDKDGERLIKCYEKGYGYLEDGTSKPERQERGLFTAANGKEIKSAWERNFLEILTYDQCILRHKIPDQTMLAQKDLDRRRKEKDATSRLQAEAAIEWQEERVVARNTLASIMQSCRDRGGTEEQARAAGRRHLLWRRDEQGTASDREVRECAVDMEWKQPNQYTWMCRMLSGTQKAIEAALEEQKKEEKRLADKAILSGTQERERMWENEIKTWAAQDRE